jgi:hypothetical protein
VPPRPRSALHRGDSLGRGRTHRADRDGDVPLRIRHRAPRLQVDDQRPEFVQELAGVVAWISRDNIRRAVGTKEDRDRENEQSPDPVPRRDTLAESPLMSSSMVCWKRRLGVTGEFV